MSQVNDRNTSAGKRVRTDDDRRESDWTCPNCGIINFSFRTICNMHSCTQSRPTNYYTGFKFESFKGSQLNMPKGSWKCEKCNEINYPFKTKCNLQNCSAKKPSDKNTFQRFSENDDDQ